MNRVPPRAARLAWAGSALVVFGAALVIGYTSIFSHFLWYDDEGYVMISVRGYLAGHPLFREVYTQYGPFFFLTRRALYALLHLPVSHDANRLIALGEWLVAAGLCGAVGARLTRSRWMGLLAAGLAFVHLEVFVKEPGHPQELCMILVALALVLGTLERRRIGFAGMGVVCAALATTKVNIAVYLLLAITLALLLATERLPLRSLACSLVGAAAVGLPSAVMRAGFELESTTAYVAVVTGGVAATLVAACAPGRPRALAWPHLVSLLVPVPLVVLAVLAMVRLEGTTWHDLADGLWFEPLRFVAVSRNAPSPLGREGIAAGAAGLVVSLATLRLWQRRPRLRWLKVVFGVGVLTAALAEFIGGARQALMDGAATRGNAATVLTYGVPFLWLLLAPDGEPPPTFEASFGRLLLCNVAVLQALVAYPVFGSQASCATVLVLVAAVVATHDAASAAATAAAPRAWRAIPFLPLVPLAIALGLKTDFCTRLYRENAPLGLWGASRVHLRADQVGTLRLLARLLPANADTFFTIMGFNSLYFWTRMDPPTYFNATLWPWMLNYAQQRVIADVLAQHERAMVVHDANLRYLARRQVTDPDGPLGAFIAANFEYVGAIANFEILIRHGRPADSLRNVRRGGEAHGQSAARDPIEQAAAPRNEPQDIRVYRWQQEAIAHKRVCDPTGGPTRIPRERQPEPD